MTLLPRPSVRNQKRLTRTMQAILAGILVYGIVAGAPKAISNGGIALLITFVPAALERNYEVPIDPWLGVWITSAVFFHTIGSAALYTRIEWWDHLTHSLSASLVAGVGYTALRAVDLHSDRIRIPGRFAFAFIVIVVLAFGVVWELFEFALDIIATRTGLTMPLAQHGLDDTVLDVTYNSIGALIVGVFGQAHLSGVAERFRDGLLARSDGSGK